MVRPASPIWKACYVIRRKKCH